MLAAAAGTIVASAFGPPIDGDLWWQQWLGDGILRTHVIPSALGNETFAAAGAPWTPQEWLFSLLLAGSTALGVRFLFVLAVAACAFGTQWLVAATALRRGATPLAAAVATALAFIACIPPLGVRAQVVAWLFVAAFAALAFDPRRRLLCVPIAIVWANVHASVLLAPATMGLVLAGDLFARAGDRRALGRTALAFAGTLIAPFLTPLTWRLPAYAVALAMSPIRSYITEWQSPFNTPFYRIEVVLATVVVLCVALPRKNRPVTLAERFVVFAYYGLALLATRHVPLVFIVGGPIAAARFAEVRAASGQLTGRIAIALDAALAAAAFACGVVAGEASRAPRPMPVAAMQSITTGAHGVRLFCTDFSWCGIAVGAPGVQVYMDARADPYPAAMFAQTLRITEASDGVALLEQTGAREALVAVDDPLAVRLDASPQWHATFRDGRFEVFRRR